VWVRCGSDCGGLLGFGTAFEWAVFKVGESSDGCWRVRPGLAKQLKAARYAGLPDGPEWEHMAQPVVVICPDCGKRNLVDPAGLSAAVERPT
jgi:hypothetical protein